MRRQTSTAPFHGIGEAALRLLSDLRAEPSKDWFAANRQRYETLVSHPMRTLVAHLDRGFETQGVPFRGDPDRSVVRASKGLRPSRGTSRYRSTARAYFSTRAGEASLMIEIGPEEASLELDFSPSADRLRLRMEGDVAALADAVRRLENAGFKIDQPNCRAILSRPSAAFGRPEVSDWILLVMQETLPFVHILAPGSALRRRAFSGP